MAWLALTRKHRFVRGLAGHVLLCLKRDAAALFDREGIRDDAIDLECEAFILWSLHVGILNARASELDRWIAALLLQGRVRRASRRWRRRDGRDLAALYRRRCQEVLATTPNIYLYRQTGNSRPRLPVTRGCAMLFLRNAARNGRRSPAHVVDELAAMLAAHFWTCVQPLEPETRTSFP